MAFLTRPLALVGMMGSGKTTLAAALAARWGIATIDSDVVAEQLMGKTIHACFAENGETFFRHWEEKALKKICENNFYGVIATGGGVVMHPSGWAFLKEHTTTVWLDVPVEELWKRLQKNPGERPLLKDKQGFLTLAAARRPYYAQAQYQVSLAGKSKDEALIMLIGLLEKQQQP
jgi:shikimate kinase